LVEKRFFLLPPSCSCGSSFFVFFPPATRRNGRRGSQMLVPDPQIADGRTTGSSPACREASQIAAQRL
jgi:hypothetical protein